MRIGSFSIPVDMVRHEPERAAQILALMRCVPLSVYIDKSRKKITYTAISFLFKERKTEPHIPVYEIFTIENEHGIVCKVRAEEIP